MNVNKGFEEYLIRYADAYCNGDVEEAKKHAIVKSVKEHYDEE